MPAHRLGYPRQWLDVQAQKILDFQILNIERVITWADHNAGTLADCNRCTLAP